MLSKLLSRSIKFLKKPAVWYYVLRVGQRTALLAQGLMAIIYWLLLINIVVANTFAAETVNHQWRNPEALNDTIQIAYNAIQHNFLLAAGTALTLTMVMAFIPKVFRNEKRMLIDSVVIVAFCIVAVIVGRDVMTAFIDNHLT